MHHFVIICFCSIFLTISSFAKTLIVSDIDDTIKVSRVLKAKSAVANYVLFRNSFLGMPEVYHYLNSSLETPQFRYLSSGYNFLLNVFHSKFLKVNNYPHGSLDLRPISSSRETFKLQKLRQYLEIDKPQVVLLFGDNGQHDSIFYETLKKENPEVKFYIFIHTVYSTLGFEGSYGKPSIDGQIQFVTSFDLSLQLLRLGLISKEKVLDLYDSLGPTLLKEDPDQERGRTMAFPNWLDCRDFRWTTNTVIESQFYRPVQDFIQSRCASLPVD